MANSRTSPTPVSWPGGLNDFPTSIWTEVNGESATFWRQMSEGTNSVHGCELLNTGYVTLARTTFYNNASESCWRCISLRFLSLESRCVCSAWAGCSSAAVSKDFVCWHKDSVQLVWAIIYQTTSTSTRTLQDNHRVGQGARKLRGCKTRLWNSSCFSSYYLRGHRTIRNQNPT